MKNRVPIGKYLSYTPKFTLSRESFRRVRLSALEFTEQVRLFTEKLCTKAEVKLCKRLTK